MVTERPRSHGLPDDGHVITKFLPQDLDRFQYTTGVLMGQEVRWNFDIVDVSKYGLAHFDGRPVVLLLPLNPATQSRGFLDNREDGHNTVKSQLCVPGSGQASHQLGNPVGVGKWSIHQVHEFHGGHRGWVTHRRSIDGFYAKGCQDTLVAVHRSSSSGLGMHVIAS